MQCRVCGKEFDRSPCPNCGYDASLDRELFPTLCNDGKVLPSPGRPGERPAAEDAPPQPGPKKKSHRKRLFLLFLIPGAVIAALLLPGLLRETPTPAAESSPSPAETQGEPASAQVGVVDYDAIYALHRPEEVVMTIDGRDVTWQEYFYAYYSQATAIEQHFETFRYYGVAVDWDSQSGDAGQTYADLADYNAENMLRFLQAAETLAAEKGVTLNEEEEASLEAAHKENITNLCGENGSEEELYEQLKSMYLPRDLYWRVMRYGYLTQALIRSEGEKLSDAEVVTWMEENGILSANQILIATMDLSTNEALDEAQVEEKTALARQIAEELQAIEDPEAREKRFLELKEQYSENGEDYVFGPGVMVEEFSNGTQALKEGEVSDPIQSSYGYYIILRRPLHADDSITTAKGTMSAREVIVGDSVNLTLEDRANQLAVEYAPGFEAPRILDYFTKAGYTE